MYKKVLEYIFYVPFLKPISNFTLREIESKVVIGIN